jgi:hypothetical protein
MKDTIDQAAERVMRRTLDEVKAELYASYMARKSKKEQQLQKNLKNQQIPQIDADKTK